ncbi:uncharacterized protein LOC131830563 isoform X1 [Mustela lutreola]|uniref:uncharacterized protein LOC131830563 isoform X1 n=1 Tax=Mustela lutreola TaxID=9666 RepID=UPI0027972241|nr:uncharacterized protein LOC131830563 isoform X1 [Mustela lutreola]XP_059028864.1 uncharacterized protein LOC131830563 isoform X1 [Mustela lutreola]XP_059028865.1 uncharacterized protein LOC131830563 isoform X1 [Mustela lutreola]
MTFVTCTGLSCTNHLQQQRGLWRVGGHRTGPSHGTFLCFGFSIRYHYNDHRHRKGQKKRIKGILKRPTDLFSGPCFRRALPCEVRGAGSSCLSRGRKRSASSRRPPLPTRRRTRGNRHNGPNEGRDGLRTAGFRSSLSAFGGRVSATHPGHFGHVSFLRCSSLKSQSPQEAFKAIAACSVDLCLLETLAVRSRTGGQVPVRRSGLPGRPEGSAFCSSLQPLLQPVLSHGHRGHTGFPSFSRASQAAPTTRPPGCLSVCPSRPLPWPVALVSLSTSSSQPWEPFTFTQVPLLHSSGAPRASLSHKQLFVWQCLCREEGRLHEDRGGLDCVRHRLQHNCQMVALL